MIGVDTNVLVRYIAQDDPEQCKKVNELFEQASAKNKLFVSSVVVVECIWVLAGCYQLSDAQARDFIQFLLSSKKVSLERSEMFATLLDKGEIKVRRLADVVIAQIAFDAGCQEFFTFDKKLKRLITQPQN